MGCYVIWVYWFAVLECSFVSVWTLNVGCLFKFRFVSVLFWILVLCLDLFCFTRLCRVGYVGSCVCFACFVVDLSFFLVCLRCFRIWFYALSCLVVFCFVVFCLLGSWLLGWVIQSVGWLIISFVVYVLWFWCLDFTCCLYLVERDVWWFVI